MKLVVDSGSTKTDWGFFSNSDDLQVIKTQGINPCHQSADEVKDIIKNELVSNVQSTNPSAVESRMCHRTDLRPDGRHT